VRKNYSIDGEKLLKFEAEGREFVNFLRSLEQLIAAVKGQYNYYMAFIGIAFKKPFKIIFFTISILFSS
jgi:hypothetical protein